MRWVSCAAVSVVAALDRSEPSAPTGTLEASRKSVHQITAIDLQLPGGGQAYDNNNRGGVVGGIYIFGVWWRGLFQPLPLPPEWDGVSANAINSSGAMAGVSVRGGPAVRSCHTL